MPVTTYIAGVKFRPPEAQAVYAELEEGDELHLSREPDNQFDTNAIKVLFDGTFIGYVPAYLAESLAPMLDDGADIKAEWRWGKLSLEFDGDEDEADDAPVDLDDEIPF